MITAQRIGDFAFGIVTGLCLGVGLGMMIGSANADGLETIDQAEVAVVANQVVDELRNHGFDVQVGTLPPAYIVRLDDGNTAETTGHSVRINERMPQACRTRLLAHELAHVFLDRKYGARDDGELVARTVEDLVVPEWQPGCDHIPRGPTFATPFDVSHPFDSSSLELRGAVT